MPPVFTTSMMMNPKRKTMKPTNVPLFDLARKVEIQYPRPVIASSNSQKRKNSTPNELFRKRSNWKIMPTTTMVMLLIKFITHTSQSSQLAQKRLSSRPITRMLPRSFSSRSMITLLTWITKVNMAAASRKVGEMAPT